MNSKEAQTLSAAERWQRKVKRRRKAEKVLIRAEGDIGVRMAATGLDMALMEEQQARENYVEAVS